MDSNRAHAQGCCTAEQQAVLDVLREAAGAPLTLGQIARLASARLPEPQRAQIRSEHDVACILATLRLREGFRRAIRKHPGGAPSSPQPAAQPVGRHSGDQGKGRPPSVLARFRRDAASRPWPLTFPVLAATGLVAGCAAIPAQQPLVFTTPVTYFPGGVVAKADVPRSFRPFDARTVTSCSGGWRCSGPHLEAVAETTKTPVGGPLAYHVDGYAEHFAQVSPQMRAWLSTHHDSPMAAAQSTTAGAIAQGVAPGAAPGAAPVVAPAVGPAVAVASAAGAGPLANKQAWTGAPPTSGSGLRLSGDLTSALWAQGVSAASPSGKNGSPATPPPGREWVAEQLARIDPTLPELHARPGPTLQAAAIAQAYPQAHRPTELVEVSGSHLVIAFDSGSQRVTPRMREALRHVAASLQAQEELQLRGRVGFRNPGAVGRALAANRANAIRTELVALGVAAARITVAEPRDGDLLAGDFDSPLNRSVSMIVQTTKVALRPTTRPTGG